MNLRVTIIVAGILLVLAGCQGRPRYGGGLIGDETPPSEKTNEPAPSSSSSGSEARNQPDSPYAVDPIKMGQIIDRYLGKPYAGQQDGVKGYDCSEFVGAVYEEYGSVHLPRTTQNLYRTGRPVKRGDLYFGDLVFFDTGGHGVSHVGIYVGFDEFAHASSSNGIVISNLKEEYYRNRYLGARRVME